MIEIVQNKDITLGESGIKNRNVFVFVDEKKFDLEKIISWMNEFSQKFRDPFILQITLFTDKDMLKKLIRFESKVWAIEFNDDEKGRRASADFYEKAYPKPQGYLRVIYYRHGGSEYVEYSPNKDTPEMVRRDLKSP